MQIDRIIYPVETLGPGKRIAIWTIGCSKCCKSCANPELWHAEQAKDIGIDVIVKHCVEIASSSQVDGITITGGDPLEQTENLLTLVDSLTMISDDILVYTGYTLTELEDILTPGQLGSLHKNISVLIDGRYIDEKNDGLSALRGSLNQVIHYFQPEKQAEYEEYIIKGRTVQNFFYGEKMISVGIHNRSEVWEGQKNG